MSDETPDYHYVFTDELVCYRIPVKHKGRKYVHLAFAHPACAGNVRIPKKDWNRTEKGAMERYLITLRVEAKTLQKQMEVVYKQLQNVLGLKFSRVEVEEDTPCSDTTST